MNSFVSVEEPEVPCDDEFNSFLISVSNLSENSTDSEFSTEKDVSSNENLISPTDCFGTVDSLPVCEMKKKYGNRKFSGKIDPNLDGVRTRSKSASCPQVQIDSTLLPVEIENNYDNSAINFECLPLEAVLMNYSEGFEYASLNEKPQNLDHNSGTDLGLEGSSFDGFSEDSNSSFEGFENKLNLVNTKTRSSTIKNNPNPRLRSTAKNYPNLRLRSKSSKHFDRNSIKFKEKENIHDKPKCISEISSSFGKYQLGHPLPGASTPKRTLQTRSTTTFQNYFKGLAIPVCSTAFQKPEEETDATRGNQQKGKKEKIKHVKKKKKKKLNENGVSQQKNEKENENKPVKIKKFTGLDEVQDISFESIQSKVSKILHESALLAMKSISDNEHMGIPMPNSDMPFLDDSDVESFEGFPSNKENTCKEDSSIGDEEFENNKFSENGGPDNLEIKNGPDDVEGDDDNNLGPDNLEIKNGPDGVEGDDDEFIGENCNKVFCTISWLESRAVKIKPVLINNGIVFELSEFAKKIAWEPYYIAEWIMRLRGFRDVEILEDDTKKINSVLKRRKAISVTFSGAPLKLKMRLQDFDAEIFSLPTVEKLDKDKQKPNKSLKDKNDDDRKYRGTSKKINKFDEIATSKLSKVSIEDKGLKNKTAYKVQEVKEIFSSKKDEGKNSSDGQKLERDSSKEPLKTKILKTKKSKFSKQYEIKKVMNKVLIQDSTRTDTKSVSEADQPVQNLKDMECNASQEENVIEESNNNSETINFKNTSFHTKDNISESLYKKNENYSVSDFGAVNTTSGSEDSNSAYKSLGKVKNVSEQELNMLELRKSLPCTPLRKDSINSEGSHSDKSINFEDLSKSSKGRIRKLTPKAQESYSHDFSGIPILNVKTNGKKSPSASNILPSHIIQPKTLHPAFKDEGKAIGPYCSKSGIDINILNSYEKAPCPITNGIVYELYNFFRERKASLTSLVHTLYRLKDIAIDKSRIITTMAKIHGMVKIMWKENLSKNSHMPFEEFHLPGPHIKSEMTMCKKPIAIKNKEVSNLLESESKKLKLNSLLDSADEEEPLPSDLNSKSPSESYNSSSGEDSDSPLMKLPETTKMSTDVTIIEKRTMSNKTFDLNSTKGYCGKITRGDIVYLYTKWLKKKMEGQANVFVTDLSKDVEELISDRKVECIRIPVGTLMSSSVKLFEEFRKLSKINMIEAKMYLLEDWLEDIKAIFKSQKSKSVENSENVVEASKAMSGNSLDPTTLKKNLLSQNEEIKSLPTSHENLSVKLPGNLNDVLTNTIKNFPPKLEENKGIKNRKALVNNVPEEYEVEKIVGYRIVKIGEDSVTEYRIRWVGFSSKDDSWINEADLNCPDILAQFWKALNKQRCMKAKNVESSSVPLELDKRPFQEKRPPSLEVISSQEKRPCRDHFSSLKKREIVQKHLPSDKISAEKQIPIEKRTPVEKLIASEKRLSPNIAKTAPVLKGQENVSPLLGRDKGSSQKFFNLMVQSLEPSLVDYHHDEENIFLKRVKVSKGEILTIFDEWCRENQEHILTGGNQKVDVNVLIARVKELMERRKVRNFNPNCIIDVCNRMSLMKAKLKDTQKVKEYLSEDFIELMQTCQKHQESLRKENFQNLKKMKQDRLLNMSLEFDKLNRKQNLLNNMENESLIIAKYLKENKQNRNFEKDLMKEIATMNKVLAIENDEVATVESLKRQNAITVKEFEACGVSEEVLDELLAIGLKIT